MIKANKSKKTSPKPVKILPAKNPRSKGEVFRLIGECTGIRRAQVATVFETLGRIMAVDLSAASTSKPREFHIPGLMKVVVIRKPGAPARRGINPFTRTEQELKATPASASIKIRPLRTLKYCIAAEASSQDRDFFPIFEPKPARPHDSSVASLVSEDEIRLRKVPESSDKQSAMSLLAVEIHAFNHDLPELLSQHAGKYAVYDGSVRVGVFDDRKDAFRAGYAATQFKRAFLVRRISERNEPELSTWETERLIE